MHGALVTILTAVSDSGLIKPYIGRNFCKTDPPYVDVLLGVMSVCDSTRVLSELYPRRSSRKKPKHSHADFDLYIYESDGLEPGL